MPAAAAISISAHEGMDMSMGLKTVPSGLPTMLFLPQMLHSPKSSNVGVNVPVLATVPLGVAARLSSGVGALDGFVDDRVEGGTEGMPVGVRVCPIKVGNSVGASDGNTVGPVVGARVGESPQAHSSLVSPGKMLQNRGLMRPAKAWASSSAHVGCPVPKGFVTRPSGLAIN